MAISIHTVKNKVQVEKIPEDVTPGDKGDNCNEETKLIVSSPTCGCNRTNVSTLGGIATLSYAGNVQHQVL